MQSQQYTVKNIYHLIFVFSIFFYNVSKTKVTSLCAALKLELFQAKKKKKKRTSECFEQED